MKTILVSINYIFACFLLSSCESDQANKKALQKRHEAEIRSLEERVKLLELQVGSLIDESAQSSFEKKAREKGLKVIRKIEDKD